MKRMDLREDIRPVSDFRANAASLLRRIRETKRSLVLTQRGHSAAVVVDVAEYERLLEELDRRRVSVDDVEAIGDPASRGAA